MAHTVKWKKKKWNRVCFLSVSLSSPKKRLFFFIQGTLHNATTRACQQHPTPCFRSQRVHVTPRAALFENMVMCLCAWTWQTENAGPFPTVSESVWACMTLCTRVGCTWCWTCLSPRWCRNKRVETLGSRWVEEEKYLYWWEPHTHLSPPPPYTRLRDRSGR